VINCDSDRMGYPVSQLIKEEIEKQIGVDNTRYCDPQGILPLRKAVAKHLSETRGIIATADRVVVFPDANASFGLCQQTHFSPGDEVVYPNPGFPLHESLINHVAAKPVPLQLKEVKDFIMSGEDIGASLDFMHAYRKDTNDCQVKLILSYIILIVLS
jgi:aspartate aminotransferase